MSQSKRRLYRNVTASILGENFKNWTDNPLSMMTGEQLTRCLVGLEDKVTDAILEADKKPQKKKSDGAQYYPLARALADVCNIDYGANTGLLFAEAKRLLRAQPTPTPELIQQHYGSGGAWYTDDFRGKLGQNPTPAAIRMTWAKVVGADNKGYTL